MGLQHARDGENAPLLRDGRLSAAELSSPAPELASSSSSKLLCVSLAVVSVAVAAVLVVGVPTSFDSKPFVSVVQSSTAQLLNLRGDKYDMHDDDDEGMTWDIPLISSIHLKKHSKAETWLKKKSFTAPDAEKRCDYIIDTFQERDVGTLEDFDPDQGDLLTKYQAQTTDENVFYRATAQVFWKDFALNGWGRGLLMMIKDEEFELNKHGFAGAIAENKKHANAFHGEEPGGTELLIHSRSTWTWITGDQHLSNFGAWRNRNGEVVFGLNDFDEGALYDFNVDVLRIAVSICNHANSVGLSKKEVKRVLNVFTESYMTAVESYFGNDNEQLFELTPNTAEGTLREFMKKVEKKKSGEKQLQKFSTMDEDGTRHFIKGDAVGVPHNETHLSPVSPEMEAAILAAFTADRYGATMMKMGWAVPQWDDSFFAVVDVARRVGSGIGSYGSDRYYVLLNGTDGLLHYEADNKDDDLEGGAIILDVKFEPKSAVRYVLTPNDAAWYDVMFANEAARVIEAQRRLSCYADPFLGWVVLPDPEDAADADAPMKPFYVRQRSPWKKGIDLDEFLSTGLYDLEMFAKQLAISTATSHVRGSPARKPGDFKTVIKELLRGYENGKPWRRAIRKLAMAYREQVLLDFECIRDYVDNKPSRTMLP
jgi:uncharacterized protein (DUF2252 family)